MTVSTYLDMLARAAIIRDTEKENINRSLANLRTKVTSYFGSEVREQITFGSYTRDTLMPRTMDPLSDVDHMVVFRDDFYRPQTYLDRLRVFCENNYGRSEIAQSRPTIQLNLNHIKFELVPAIKSDWSGLRIPGKASGYQDWIQTDPNGFNALLTAANGRLDYKLKPVIRLMKYWNADNGYVYESYELEQLIVSFPFAAYTLFSTTDLKTYLFAYILNNLSTWYLPQWKIDKIVRARQIVERVKALEGRGEWTAAEQEIKRLFPVPAGVLA